MKKENLNSNKSGQAMGLTTLSDDELKNVYGGAKVYYVVRVENGKVYFEIVTK